MKFIMTATHTQISLFDNFEPDFNNWTDQHVAQGFSWRPGHVSFGLPDRDGEVLVEISIIGEFPPIALDVTRCIRVPLEIKSQLFVATTINENLTDTPIGMYQVEFRLRESNLNEADHPYGLHAEFLLRKDNDPEFSIVVRDKEITADNVLSKHADPA